MIAVVTGTTTVLAHSLEKFLLLQENHKLKNPGNDTVLVGPLSALKEFNLGIILIGIYFLFEFGAAQDMYPIIRALTLPYILSALTVFYAILQAFKGNLGFGSGTTKIFTALCVFIIVYTLIATKTSYDVEDTTKLFIVYLSQYVIIVSCVKKPSQFILLINIWLFSVVLSSYHGIMQGGLVWGSRWIADENHISLMAATALPFAIIFFKLYKPKLMKASYLVCIGLLVALNVIAASRGGVLSMIVVIFLCWLLFEHKFRLFLLGSLGVLLVFSYAPERLFDEMKTLEQGTEEVTADDRLYLWGIGFKMFYDHPVLGVGPRNYHVLFQKYEKQKRYKATTKRVPHSTPVHMLAELGIVGIILLLMLLRALYKNWKVVFRLKRQLEISTTKEQSSIYVNISHACAISIVGFWFGALFLSLMPYPFFWCLVPFSEAWKNITVSQIKELNNASENKLT